MNKVFSSLRRFVKLAHRNHFYAVGSDKLENETAKHLRFKIKAKGPLTVAEYMKDILVNPSTGYYMHRNVFGEAGDFVTSPELGQIFGELVAVWFLNEWSKAGSPKPLQLVELGPGTGTLCHDILAVFAHFDLQTDISVKLVEVSPYLSDLQAKKLCLDAELNFPGKEDSLVFKENITKSGVPISWYKHLDDVPNDFTLLLAHEFFDVLPVHKFRKTEKGYRELLVDIDLANENYFRFVLANSETPANLFIDEKEERLDLEISPESLVLTQKIAGKLARHGGFALIADYGHHGTSGDTFRAFKKHHQQDPLLEPGSADLTADVDFAALKKIATEKNEVLAFGPIHQRDFLLNMGIEYRLAKLKENARDEGLKSLQYSYDMMTDPDKMGHRFQFLALASSTLGPILKKHPMAGF